MLAYLKRKWRFLLVVAILLLLNFLVWSYVVSWEHKEKVKPVAARGHAN
ncbi:hypothetical protein GWO14_09490 [candidate division KSB1 bacterium]|nr:hypothetical protein [candidate division KSB1 bacterium]